MRFLYGDPRGVADLDPSDAQAKAFRLTDDGGLELSQALAQKPLARACSEWIDKSVDIRTLRQANLLHGKMYHVDQNGEGNATLAGSSNLTRRGLGMGTNPNTATSTAWRPSSTGWWRGCTGFRWPLWSQQLFLEYARQQGLNDIERCGTSNLLEFFLGSLPNGLVPNTVKEVVSRIGQVRRSIPVSVWTQCTAIVYVKVPSFAQELDMIADFLLFVAGDLDKVKALRSRSGFDLE